MAEGRRGGQCQQLGALVQGGWKACVLAIPPFAPTWERLDGIITWQPESFGIEEEFSAEAALQAYAKPHTYSSKSTSKSTSSPETVSAS